MQQTIASLPHSAHISFISSDAILQYHAFDAALVVGYDPLLAIADYRSSIYLASILMIIRSQAQSVLLATRHLDDWTHIGQKDGAYFRGPELAWRKQFNLPPYSLPVTFISPHEAALKRLQDIPSANKLVWQRIELSHHGYRVTVHVPAGIRLASLWPEISKLKIDILPHYIE